MRKDGFGQAASQDANISRAVDIHIEDEPALLQIPVACRKTSGCVSEELDIGGCFLITRLNLATPKGGFQTDAPRQGRLFLDLQTMGHGDVFPPPILLEAFRTA